MAGGAKPATPMQTALTLLASSEHSDLLCHELSAYPHVCESHSLWIAYSHVHMQLGKLDLQLVRNLLLQLNKYCSALECLPVNMCHVSLQLTWQGMA